jgi:hypothetical protein
MTKPDKPFLIKLRAVTSSLKLITKDITDILGAFSIVTALFLTFAICILHLSIHPIVISFALVVSVFHLIARYFDKAHINIPGFLNFTGVPVLFVVLLVIINLYIERQSFDIDTNLHLNYNGGLITVSKEYKQDDVTLLKKSTPKPIHNLIDFFANSRSVLGHVDQKELEGICFFNHIDQNIERFITTKPLQPYQKYPLRLFGEKMELQAGTFDNNYTQYIMSDGSGNEVSGQIQGRNGEVLHLNGKWYLVCVIETNHMQSDNGAPPFAKFAIGEIITSCSQEVSSK